MTSEQFLFWLFAVLTCGGAFAVVITQNVVRMAFWLIVSLGSVAGLFFLLNADFLGAAQLLIYVGGTVVLLIFGVMLTASGPYLQIKTSPAEGFLAGGIAFLFLVLIVSTVYAVDWDHKSQLMATHENGQATGIGPQPGYNPEQQGNTTRPIAFALLGMRPDKDLASNQPADLMDTGDVDDLSQAVYMGDEMELSTGYLLVFEIISVHLLVVLVGAAYLARAKRRVDASEVA